MLDRGAMRVAEPPVESLTRQRIVGAARRHFFAHGFRTVTMDDIAEELGMSKKTLYAHFPSKTALVEAVLLDKLGGIACSFSGRQVVAAVN